MTTKMLRTNIFFYIDSLVEYLISPDSPERAYPIITSLMPVQPDPCILYNTEQLTRADQLELLLTRIQSPDVVEVWDFSTINIEILATKGIKAIHCPIRIADTHRQRLKRFLTAPKKWDVGISCTLTRRRANILNALSKHKVSCLLITNKNGDVRDALLAQCRIILNVHAKEDYKVFETARCEQWLDVGQLVISEISLDDDPRAITAAYDKLVPTILDYLAKNRDATH